ncbi:hypothetical protein ACFY1A_00270 [Streptomyces sp. NPDC001520]|uniref:aggregation-promoting factor C-terminal-like domain-containing protein n=1 Tax=Streptomyces sp. NPDC001520 TaxID=3364581 RepID=UPI0036944939
MADLDIVGGAAVDVVPVIPQFHTKLKALVLPIADKVGAEAGRKMGEAISNNIVVAIPSAINQGGQAAKVAATRQGENTGGAFARSIKAKLEVAFRAMPKLDIRLGDTGVDAELARIRARMETLTGKRVGIDVSVAEAEAEIKRLDAELKRLGASHPNVAVRADTATARASLAEIRAEIAAIDGKTARIDVDTSGASGAVMNLGVQIAALTAIPLGPVLAAGLGGFVSMLTSATVGVGAFGAAAIPAIKGVSEALNAQKAAQSEADKATGKSANTLVQAQQRAIQMAGAQQSLAAAHRNAARSIAQANVQVEAAERAVADAAQRAADQRRQSAENVRRAEQSLADAKRGVQRAERSLTDAQISAKQAQVDLTQARQDAARQLRALDDQLTRGQLDQREATLRVTEAQQELQAVMADPRATDLQRQRAQLSLDEAQQAVKEQAQDYKDLQKSAAEQKKAGVEGSDAVKNAADRLHDAQRNVVDQTQAVADAQRNVAEQSRAVAQAQQDAARAQRDAAQSVVDAQQGVVDATANAAEAQITAADQIATAERGIESARLSSAKATGTASTAQEEYRRKLAALTPAQRDLYDSIAGPKGIKRAFSDWSKELQPDVLPLFTRGVDGATKSLPFFTPIVRDAAKAIGELWDEVSKELKSPFWQGFKKDIQKSVKPAILGIGRTFGNVITGIAGVIDAFLPHMDGIADESDKITGKFAKWGKSLKGSPAFEKFLDYVKRTAPGLGDFLGDILETMLDVAKAASPLSSTMFDVLSPILDGISWLAKNAPWAIQGLWAMYFASKAIGLLMPLVAAGIWLYNTAVGIAALETFTWAAALQVTGIVPAITAIIVAVGALVLGVIYAWKHWGWFRDAVVGAWEGIKAATSVAWHVVLKPIFDGIWAGLKWVGDKAMWLWTNGFQPAFKAIGDAAKLFLTLILTIIIAPIYLAIQGLGWIAMWLWDKAFKPALDGIGGAFKSLWETAVKPFCNWIGDKCTWLYEKKIAPAFRGAKRVVGSFGDGVKGLWNEDVKPVFGWIADKAEWLYAKAVKPPMNKLRDLMGKVADSFKAAKKNIDTAWKGVSKVVKDPINIVVNTVYNRGIVRVWNAVADIVGAHKLDPVEKFATGGIMPGYTPGRDNQLIAVGGGEAIMRPEWTRAVGPGYVHAMNAAARNGGVSGVQRMVNAGMPAFADGGIVGWIKNRVKDVGNFFKSGWDAVTNPGKVFDATRSWIRDKMSDFADNKWAKTVAKLPISMLTKLKEKVMSWFSANGDADGRVKTALTWAKSQAGKPYQWGGVGNPSWDCSGFMSGIQKVIEGKNPKGRIWSTFSFQGKTAPKGWVKDLTAPFMIGVTNRGKGHTAGTLAGVNVESRGGDGVVVGKRARGARSSFFDSIYGFKPSIAPIGGSATQGAAQATAKQMLGEFGFSQKQWPALKKLWEHESAWRWNAYNRTSGAYGIPQALPGTKMRSAGADWQTNPATQIKWGLGYIKDRYGSPNAAWSKWNSRFPHWYDDGGYLPPGLSLVANGTGKPEPVFTSGQWDTLRASAGSGRGSPEIHADVHVFVGDREITDIVRVEVAAQEVATANAISAGRW